MILLQISEWEFLSIIFHCYTLCNYNIDVILNLIFPCAMKPISILLGALVLMLLFTFLTHVNHLCNYVVCIGLQSVILLHHLFIFLHSDQQYFGNSKNNVSLENVVEVTCL